MRCFPILVLAGLAACANGQSVTLSVLTDSEADSPFILAGNRPSLHNGQAAFLALDMADAGELAIVSGPIDGSTPFSAIVNQNDLVPWMDDGMYFISFDNPTIWNGQSFFTSWGTYTGLGTLVLGLLQGDAKAIEQFPFPPVNYDMPSLGDPGMFIKTVLVHYDGTFTNALTAQQPMPGGGTVVSSWSNILEGYAQGGEYAVMTPKVNTPAGQVKRGVYAWRISDGQLGLIANFDTTIPVLGGTFDLFQGVDTDGTTVSFFGSRSGAAGVFTAPIGSEGQGPLTPIAVTGQMSPWGLPYTDFEYTAVDGDVVFFGATIGDSLVSGKFAYLAYCNGTIIPIFATGDAIDGKVMFDGRINHRAVEGNDMVMWARYDGGSKTMLLHVHVDGCQVQAAGDLDGDGDVDGIDLAQLLAAWGPSETSAGALADLNDDSIVDGIDLAMLLASWGR